MKWVLVVLVTVELVLTGYDTWMANLVYNFMR